MSVYPYVVDWERLPEMIAAINVIDEANSWELFEEGEGDWWQDAEPDQFGDDMVFHAAAAHAFLEIEQRLQPELRDRLGDFIVAFAGQMMRGRTEPNDLPNNDKPRDVAFVGLSPVTVQRLKGLIEGLNVDEAVALLRAQDAEQAENFVQFIAIWRDVVFQADELGWGVLTSWC